MNSQPLSPEQQKKVKRAKRILWCGIIGIIVIGSLVAVYFVFLKNASPEIKPTPIDLDTSHWQPYTNEQYGFSLKFPMEWTLEQAAGSCTDEELSAGTCSADIVKLNFLSDYRVYISYQGTNPEHLAIPDWLTTVKHQTEAAKYTLDYNKETGITLEGLDPAVYQVLASVYFSIGDKVFRVEWFDNNKQNSQVFQVFNKILLSFEFVNTVANTNTTTNINSIVDTSDWLTYENTKYNYSVKVPQGWTVNTTGLCGDNRVGFASEPFDCSPDGYSGTYSVIINTGDQSLAEIKVKSPDMNFVETTIGGQPALQFLYQFNSDYLGGEFTRTGYMVIYQGNTYTIGEELAGRQSGPTDGLVDFAQTIKFL